MIRTDGWLICALAAGASVSCSALVGAAENLGEAFREGDFHVDLRVRYESVEQSGFAEDADALTGRLRVGFQTAPLGKTALLAEAAVLEDLVSDYNSTTNGQTQYPVVADPVDFAVINRLAFINKSLERATLTFGRQRIALDDSRFVGNVGWRQHEQTFDGLRAQISATGFTTDLTYASQVNRIFGPDSTQGKWAGDIVLANASRTLPIGMLTLFDYFLDLDTAAFSSNTVGVRLTGSKRIGSLGASYSLSYARQEDAGANPANYSADYYFAEGGLNVSKIGVALGYELLGGDGVNAFSTPLATGHAFQGWADKFLGTPAAGIEDRYLKLSYPIGKRGRFTTISAMAFFQDFSADTGSAHFGEELDLQLVARTERVALTLKYSDYRAAALFTDTDKLWLSVDYAF
jgi:hypothetical protein